ncbi:hypothetical protein DOTSEDRAFT_19107 [Dothistroma septosporum NZE10]|uniref:PEBP-like protein n=1 Tax=Dothistroma septosporum (strain NZE10 / CBS 128990) TaxID=675120 RepID=N1Q007_DOTSN|nr:hypothetical protein DOTSEDRAFT_19107 [Dothistroma septosporum NZE10]
MKFALAAARAVALLITGTLAAPQAQQPLHTDKKSDLIDELKRAEIIPTVLDPFQPVLSVDISWKKASASVGNTIKPKKLQNTPEVLLIDDLPDSNFPWPNDESLPQLTIALTDPDAKSRDNPIWSEMCHWLATEVPLSNGTHVSKSFKEIVPYKAPGPPPRTGKHRYVFAALAPRNGTHEALNLTTPADRQHWGYGKVRKGLRNWAEENGLAVIGANFIYAQDKKQ